MFVKSDKHGLALVLILEKNDFVLVHQRACRWTMSGRERTQRLMPLLLAVHVVADDTAVPEERDNQLAIGDGC